MHRKFCQKTNKQKHINITFDLEIYLKLSNFNLCCKNCTKSLFSKNLLIKNNKLFSSYISEFTGKTPLQQGRWRLFMGELRWATSHSLTGSFTHNKAKHQAAEVVAWGGPSGSKWSGNWGPTQCCAAVTEREVRLVKPVTFLNLGILKLCL